MLNDANRLTKTYEVATEELDAQGLEEKYVREDGEWSPEGGEGVKLTSVVGWPFSLVLSTSVRWCEWTGQRLSLVLVFPTSVRRLELMSGFQKKRAGLVGRFTGGRLSEALEEIVQFRFSQRLRVAFEVHCAEGARTYMLTCRQAPGACFRYDEKRRRP